MNAVDHSKVNSLCKINSAHKKIAEALIIEEERFEAAIKMVSETNSVPAIVDTWPKIAQLFRRITWKEYALLSLKADYSRLVFFNPYIMLHVAEDCHRKRGGAQGNIEHKNNREKRRRTILNVTARLKTLAEAILSRVDVTLLEAEDQRAIAYAKLHKQDILKLMQGTQQLHDAYKITRYFGPLHF